MRYQNHEDKLGLRFYTEIKKPIDWLTHQNNLQTSKLRFFNTLKS